MIFVNVYDYYIASKLSTPSSYMVTTNDYCPVPYCFIFIYISSFGYYLVIYHSTWHTEILL